MAAFNKDAEENALRWQEGETTRSPPDVESDVQDDNTTQELGTSDNQLDILDDILNDHDDSSSNKLLQQNTKPVPADKETAQQNGDDVDDLDDLLNMDSSVAKPKVVSEVVSKAVPDADADDLDDLLSGTTSKSGGAVNMGQAETTTDGKSNGKCLFFTVKSLSTVADIEAETKWLPFSRHFQMHFLEWKYVNFDLDFIEVCS